MAGLKMKMPPRGQRFSFWANMWETLRGRQKKPVNFLNIFFANNSLISKTKSLSFCVQICVQIPVQIICTPEELLLRIPKRPICKFLHIFAQCKFRPLGAPLSRTAVNSLSGGRGGGEECQRTDGKVGAGFLPLDALS